MPRSEEAKALDELVKAVQKLTEEVRGLRRDLQKQGR